MNLVCCDGMQHAGLGRRLVMGDLKSLINTRPPARPLQACNWQVRAVFSIRILFCFEKYRCVCLHKQTHWRRKLKFKRPSRVMHSLPNMLRIRTRRSSATYLTNCILLGAWTGCTCVVAVVAHVRCNLHGAVLHAFCSWFLVLVSPILGPWSWFCLGAAIFVL